MLWALFATSTLGGIKGGSTLIFAHFFRGPKVSRFYIYSLPPYNGYSMVLKKKKGYRNNDCFFVQLFIHNIMNKEK